MSLFITKKDEICIFINTFKNLIILFALIISVNGLATLFNIFSIGGQLFSKQIPSDLTKDIVQIDSNFALLLVFFGIVSLVILLSKPQGLIRTFFLNLILTIYSVNIFFSGSRRGFFILTCIIFLLFVVQLFTFVKKKIWLTQIGSGTRFFLMNIVLLAIFGCFFVFKCSYGFKNRTLEIVGSKNLVATKAKIALKIFKYNSVFNKTNSYSDIYNILWSPDISSNGAKDPDSGWGKKIHKTIFPLTGNNVEIVPGDAKGYLMDNTCNADTLNGYALSATWISNDSVDETKVLNASVYCYVSKDCDLSMVEICSLGAMGNPGAAYNLQKKGYWQKLSFRVNCSKGNSSVLLYFSKFGVTNFSLLNGYVIFAFPQVQIIDKKDSTLSYSKGSNKLNTKKDQNDNYISEENGNIFSIGIDHLNRDVEFNKTKSFGEAENIHTNDNYFNNNISEAHNYMEASIFCLNKKLLNKLYFPGVDADPIRRWASRLISEDTTYYGFKHILKVNSISSNFLGSRIMRWQFAWQIYTIEYNWKQKIFGGGFNFLNWFGYCFLRDKTNSDYPHNPFLSVLLYSGIVGLILYIIFIYKIFYFYIKYIKEYYIFFIFFLITFFFSFFSAGSPFDPPIMGFFVILPFFIHNVHKTELNRNIIT